MGWGLRLDRILAVSLGAVVLYGLLLVSGKNFFTWPIMFVFGLSPSVLLWLDQRYARLGAAFLGLPCCFSVSVFCDIVNDGSNAVWHPMHDWIWLLVPYGLLRAIFWRRVPQEKAP